VLLAVPFKHRSEQSLLSFPHLDKVIHLLLFCILSFLWSEYAKSKHSYKTIHIIFIIFSSILYGVVLEYIQHYTGRDFDPADMLANGSGVIVGILIKKSRHE
jgi:VanZ family protein